MALPGKRRSSSSKRRRASHFALKPTHLSTCPNCAAKVLPHHVCLACGMYRGRKFITTRTESLQKRTAKRKKAM